MLVTRQQIRKIQTGLLRKLEQTECQTERKVLLGELEYFEAIGDSLKGLPLSAEQKLLLFTKEEYLVRRKRENDQEIYQSLGVSRRGFYLWKKRLGLVKTQRNLRLERRSDFAS